MRKFQIRHVVVAERLGALLIPEQDEGREQRKLERLVKDQGRLDPTVGEEKLSIQLWELGGRRRSIR